MKVSFLNLFLLLFLFSCSEQKGQKSFAPERKLVLDNEVSNISYSREILANRSIKRVLLFGDSMKLESGKTRDIIHDTLDIISSSFKRDKSGFYYGEVTTKLLFLKNSAIDSLILKELDENKWLVHFSSDLLEDQIISPSIIVIDRELTVASDIFLQINEQDKKPVEDLFDIKKDSVILNFSFLLKN